MKRFETLDSINKGKVKDTNQIQVMDMCQNLQFSKEFSRGLHIHFLNSSILQDTGTKKLNSKQTLYF